MEPAVTLPAVSESVPRVVAPLLAVIPAPELSVVVVNYRQWGNTSRLTRQILHSKAGRGGLAEVVVVDNHSPTQRWKSRLRRTPGVSLRCLGRNRGFARGVNEGCRLSRGEWFLLLNPDVTVPAGFLDAALDYARRIQIEEPNAGVIGFRVRNTDGTPQASSGQFPTLPSTLLSLLRRRSVRKCRILHGRKRRAVPWVTGCCLLIRRACFEQIGGFERDFFLYYEDVDFCRRARAAGWSVWHEPAVHVMHHHPLHVRAVPPRMRLLTRHGLLTYARRHWPREHFWALAVLIRAEAGLRRRLALARNRRGSAAVFRQLGRIATDMLFDRVVRARRRLQRVVGTDGGKIRRTEGRPKSNTPPVK